jgi:prephenate dehydratase
MTRFDRIHTLRTLGPAGTNCHAAAEAWFRRQDRDPDVRLHATLEDAILRVRDEPNTSLMACAAYPLLHAIIYENLEWLDMVDTILLPTHPMLLASRRGAVLQTVATHPAPQALVPAGLIKKLVTSNAQAAIECAEGEANGCITTLPAAREHNLAILRDFGPVGMAFTIHAHRHC